MSKASDQFIRRLPLGRDVSVIASDANGLVALAKPSGVLSHPNTANEQDRSLLQAAYTMEGEVYQWTDADGEHRAWLLNRLDSATSGVILLCASEEMALVMRLHFRQKKVRKVYNALVFGRSASTMQLWRDHLAVNRQAGQIRTHARGNIPAECRMTLLKTRGPFSLLKLEPITGRSHQLRVQCSQRHLSIIGDATYGDFARNREFAKATGLKRMFLHSLETTFDYEYKGRRCHFSATAPLPPEFEKVR